VDLISVFEGVGALKAGQISEERLTELEDCACPGCGSCAGMFTANSMNCLTEALGLGLPGNGTIPAVTAARIRLAKAAGMKAVEIVRQDIRPRDIATLDAYCKSKFIDLVPLQNTYGHMYDWLALPEFWDIREKPSMNGATTVALTNPKTIQFLNNLYDDMLPSFSSNYINVCADETGEVGIDGGQGKAYYPNLSKAEIYVEGLKTLKSIVDARGKTMMYWGDMIVDYYNTDPQIYNNVKAALGNSIAMNWGYFTITLSRQLQDLKQQESLIMFVPQQLPGVHISVVLTKWSRTLKMQHIGVRQTALSDTCLLLGVTRDTTNI
jgi:hypothetical protein